jgi:hypothetical protein
MCGEGSVTHRCCTSNILQAAGGDKRLLHQWAWLKRVVNKHATLRCGGDCGMAMQPMGGRVAAAGVCRCPACRRWHRLDSAHIRCGQLPAHHLRWWYTGPQSPDPRVRPERRAVVMVHRSSALRQLYNDGGLTGQRNTSCYTVRCLPLHVLIADA